MHASFGGRIQVLLHMERCSTTLRGTHAVSSFLTLSIGSECMWSSGEGAEGAAGCCVSLQSALPRHWRVGILTTHWLSLAAVVHEASGSRKLSLRIPQDFYFMNCNNSQVAFTNHLWIPFFRSAGTRASAFAILTNQRRQFKLMLLDSEVLSTQPSLCRKAYMWPSIQACQDLQGLSPHYISHLLLRKKELNRKVFQFMFPLNI